MRPIISISCFSPTNSFSYERSNASQGTILIVFSRFVPKVELRKMSDKGNGDVIGRSE